MTCLSLITNDINNIIYSLGLWQSFKPLIHLGSLLGLFNPISDIRMSRGILGDLFRKGGRFGTCLSIVCSVCRTTSSFFLTLFDFCVTFLCVRVCLSSCGTCVALFFPVLWGVLVFPVLFLWYLGLSFLLVSGVVFGVYCFGCFVFPSYLCVFSFSALLLWGVAFLGCFPRYLFHRQVYLYMVQAAGAIPSWSVPFCGSHEGTLERRKEDFHLGTYLCVGQ